MGVTGLWSVVAPTARPTKLETLNRKRLAVDASIWIYQFLKAVRDKEGNALRNSHVVGFFRRICKLLYFGILPVFVFDGGAPGLKRETIQKRKRRREGRREDATRTAGKLLAVQVARAAEEEDRRRRDARHDDAEETIPEGEELVYVEELGMSRQERQKERAGRFRKKDQYHLPDLDMSLEAMGAPNDPRIMSQAELEEYARQFHSGEDVNLYDFSKIDFESPFFLSLPAGDRYNILNAARLRSRLRMGYSKEQLDGMFPDRMAFSRFQIERVKERNELTQRLMHINGMNEDWNQGGRIAGEKGKEYILVKNEGVEGGWALGVVSNKQGVNKEDAIDVDEEEKSAIDDDEEDDDDEFEDVAIEGLNRLPKSLRKARRDLREVDYDVSYEQAAEEIARKRKAVYGARRQAAEMKSDAQTDQTLEKKSAAAAVSGDNDLFVAQDEDDDEMDELFEDIPMDAIQEDDDDLQKAIAMSLEDGNTLSGGFINDEHKGHTSDVSSNDDEMDLAAALAASRKSERKVVDVTERKPRESPKLEHGFSGPLPFESLNLGQSILGKRKADRIEQDMSGGFDRDAGDDAFRKPKKTQPLPSWFNASSGANFRPQSDEDDSDDHTTYGREDVDRREFLHRQATREVIDLEAEEADDASVDQSRHEQVYDPQKEATEQSDDDKVSLEGQLIDMQQPVIDDSAEQAEKVKAAQEREERYKLAREIAADNELSNSDNKSTRYMGDIADDIQADPPTVEGLPGAVSDFQPALCAVDSGTDTEVVEWSESDGEEQNLPSKSPSQEDLPTEADATAIAAAKNSVSDGDSGDEAFEDVEMATSPQRPDRSPPPGLYDTNSPLFLVEDEEQADHDLTDGKTNGQSREIDDYLSESEEELMRQLALEAEGHAEFASSLNQLKTSAEAARDYENELKQLRNQQKKDRRDADEVTQVMIQECQALLRLFGLPYITAPMEAEAQCAELVHLGLVDGIVTDDSDIFLFGGTRIYKNMFNAAKFVECYVSQDLEKEYDLNRNKLIRFAHLLGSDYTEGIPGIGPVTALEIISDFDSLEEFKEWCSKVQLGRPQDLENQLTTAFRRKFKKTVQKKLFLPPVFPDLRVDYAYLNPEVDPNPEEFQWGIPDLDKLRSFLMATIGWTQDRTDEILVPVIRDMNKRQQEGTQANITRFFAGGAGAGAAPVEGAAPRNRTGKESGRMKNAYARLRGEARKKRLQASYGDPADEQHASDADNDEDDEQGDVVKGRTSGTSEPLSDAETSDFATRKARQTTKRQRKATRS